MLFIHHVLPVYTRALLYHANVKRVFTFKDAFIRSESFVIVKTHCFLGNRTVPEMNCSRRLQSLFILMLYVSNCTSFLLESSDRLLKVLEKFSTEFLRPKKFYKVYTLVYKSQQN